jgi:hypothetical protein
MGHGGGPRAAKWDSEEGLGLKEGAGLRGLARGQVAYPTNIHGVRLTWFFYPGVRSGRGEWGGGRRQKIHLDDPGEGEEIQT